MSEVISFYNYTLLSKEAQYELLFLHGTFIESKVRKNITYVLYKLYDFFVEISYEQIENRVIDLTCYKSGV